MEPLHWEPPEKKHPNNSNASKTSLHYLERKEKEFWSEINDPSFVNLESILNSSWGSTFSTVIDYFFFLKMDNSQEERFWNSYIETKMPYSTTVLVLDTIFVGVLFFNSISPHWSRKGNDIFDLTHILLQNNCLLWICMNLTLIFLMRNVSIVMEQTGTGIKTSWLIIGYYIVVIRILNYISKLVWLYLYTGSYGNSIFLIGNSHDGLVLFMLELVQMSTYVMQPFPWPWPLIFLSVELPSKILGLLAQWQYYRSEEYIRDIITLTLVSTLSIFGYGLSSALYVETSMRLTFIDLELQESLSIQKRDFISLLCSEIRVPLHLIHAGCRDFIEMVKYQSYDRLESSLQQYSKTLTILADDILLLLRLEEGRFSDLNVSTRSFEVFSIFEEAVKSASLVNYGIYREILQLDIVPKNLAVKCDQNIFAILVDNIIRLLGQIVDRIISRLEENILGMNIRIMVSKLKIIEQEERNYIEISVKFTNEWSDVDIDSCEDTLYFIFCQSIAEHLGGKFVTETNCFGVVIPMEFETVKNGLGNKYSQAKKKEKMLGSVKYESTGKDFSDITESSRVEKKKEFSLRIGIYCEDSTLEICLRDLLYDIGADMSKVIAIPINILKSYDELADVLLKYEIVFSDSIQVCAALRACYFAGSIVYFAGSLIYEDKYFIDCDYKLSIPCLQESRAEFQKWIAEQFYYSDFDGAMKSRESSGSNQSFGVIGIDDLSKEYEVSDVDSGDIFDMIASYLSIVISAIASSFWIGQPKFEYGLHEIYHRWMFNYSLSGPKKIFYYVQMICMILMWISHFLFDGISGVSSATIVVFSLISMSTGLIDKYIIIPFNVDYFVFWVIYGFFMFLFWLFISIVVYYNFRSHSFDLFRPMNLTEFYGTRFGVLKGFQIFQSLIVIVFVSISRARFIPYPWNALVFIGSFIRLLVMTNLFCYSLNLMDLRVPLSTIITGISLLCLFDVYNFEFDSRREFLSFRRKLLDGRRMEKWVNLWSQESFIPLIEILKNKSEMLIAVRELIGCNELKMDDVRRYNSLAQGFAELSQLLDMINFKKFAKYDSQARVVNGKISLQPNSEVLNESTVSDRLHGNDDSPLSSFDAKSVVMTEWEIKKLCKSLCSFLELKDIESTVVIEVDVSLSIIRTDKNLFVSVLSFALNNTMRYLIQLCHRFPSLKGFSHQIIVRITSEFNSPMLNTLSSSSGTKKFTDARSFVIDVVHSVPWGFEEKDANLNIKAGRQMNIGIELYQDVLKAFASSIGSLSEFPDDFKFYSWKVKNNNMFNGILLSQQIVMMYYLFPFPIKPIFSEKIAFHCDMKRFLYCQTTHQQKAVIKYLNWKKCQNARNSSGDVNTADFSASHQQTLSHSCSLLFISSVYDFAAEVVDEHIMDEMILMIICFQKHGWIVNTIGLAQLNTMTDFDNFDCIVVDSFIDINSISPKNPQKSCEKVVMYLKSLGYDNYLAGLLRSEVSDEDEENVYKPMLDYIFRLPLFVVNAPNGLSKIDDITEDACKMAVFGRNI